jgi:hypothetical protein
VGSTIGRHRSVDGTSEILERYRRDGLLRVFREEAQFGEQQEWQTSMVRCAFTDHDADWVLLGDADEFWWPRGGSLKDALGRVPDAFGSVRGFQLDFVPLAGEGGTPFAERMIVRLSASAPINDPATPFRPAVKVAARAGSGVRVGGGGGHQVFGTRGAALEAWEPLEILHFPLRSREQCVRKYEKASSGWKGNPRGDLARARRSSMLDRAHVIWDRLALDESEVRKGLTSGSLAIDVRLRDALRGACAADGSATVSAPRSTVFIEAEIVRRQRWADELAARVHALERA